LRGCEPMIVRAIYEFLIQRYLNRPYMPGLLRLLAHSLASRGSSGDWALLEHLCQLVISQDVPFMSNRNLAALINYLTSLSIKYNGGQSQVSRCTPSRDLH
jgi:hypothetical protein